MKYQNSFWIKLFLLITFLLTTSACCTLPRVTTYKDPLNAEEHYFQGYYYETQQEYDLAVGEYKSTINLDGDFVPALINLANIYYSQKKYTEAEPLYQKALSLEPDRAEIYNNLACLYIEQNSNLELAEELLRKALNLNSDLKLYLLDTLGMALSKQDRYEEAITAFKEAIQLTPPEEKLLLAEEYLHLGEAYLKINNQEKARQALNETIRLGPDSPSGQKAKKILNKIDKTHLIQIGI